VSAVLVIVEQLRRAVPGGIGTYATGLVRGLQEMAAGGEDVPPLALYASRPPRRGDELGRFGVPVRSSALPGPVLTRAWALGVADAPSGYGVVHGVSLAVPPARCASLVVTIHDLLWRQEPQAFPPRGRRWHDAALRRALRRADRFVVPSEQVAADLQEAGAATGRVEVIPEGADHLPPPDQAGADELLERLGVHGPYLLSVGTLEPRKNLARLVEAHRLALPELPEPWPLLVVGPTGWGDGDVTIGSSGARRHPLAGLTSPGPTAPAPTASGHRVTGPRAGIPAGPGPVVFTGRVPDAVLAGLYARAELLVYVPLAEGFGLPPVEAMAAGTPVVASPVPSVADAAEIVDPRDVASIAAGIVAVAGDPSRRGTLVAAGRRRAGTLTWRSAARQHVDLWHQLDGRQP